MGGLETLKAVSRPRVRCERHGCGDPVKCLSVTGPHTPLPRRLILGSRVALKDASAWGQRGWLVNGCGIRAAHLSSRVCLTFLGRLKCFRCCGPHSCLSQLLSIRCLVAALPQPLPSLLLRASVGVQRGCDLGPPTSSRIMPPLMLPVPFCHINPQGQVPGIRVGTCRVEGLSFSFYVAVTHGEDTDRGVTTVSFAKDLN